MAAHGLPVLYALFVWWFSTGLILYLDRRGRRTFRWSVLAATAALGAAVYGLVLSREAANVGGAYAAFSCALVVWGWHEMTFLMGLVTGPRRAASRPDSRGWRRFAEAASTLIYHEIALALTAVGLVALTWGAANQVGTWTFLILWGMRLSAKLNAFLGVPNMTEDFLPEHLAYLKTYFRKKPINALFPLSVTAGTLLGGLLVAQAAAPGADAFATAGNMLLAALTALAVLEHWFLVLPLPDAALWRWALPRPAGKPAAAPADATTDPSRAPSSEAAPPMRAIVLKPLSAERGGGIHRVAPTSWRSP